MEMCLFPVLKAQVPDQSVCGQGPGPRAAGWDPAVNLPSSWWWPSILAIPWPALRFLPPVLPVPRLSSRAFSSGVSVQIALFQKDILD